MTGSTPRPVDDVDATTHDAILERLRQLRAEGLAVGAQVTVHHRGRVVADVAFGASHPDGSPITVATPFAVFSFSKAVVAAALFRLISDGLIALDDAVGTYIPEFATAGKETVTVEQLLSHEAGVPALAGELAPSALVSPAAMVAAISALVPAWVPGEAAIYHPLTATAIAAELVVRVSGSSLVDATASFVLEPLGMHDSTWGRPDGATEFAADDEPGNPLVDLVVGAKLGHHGLAAVGLWSTAGDMAKFMAAWLPSGVASASAWGNVVREAMRPRHLMRPGGGRHYACGFFVGNDPDAPWAFGSEGEVGTYGHPGLRNVAALGDPEADLAIAMAFNVAPEQAASDRRMSGLIDLIRSCCRD